MFDKENSSSKKRLNCNEIKSTKFDHSSINSNSKLSVIQFQNKIQSKSKMEFNELGLKSNFTQKSNHYNTHLTNFPNQSISNSNFQSFTTLSKYPNFFNCKKNLLNEKSSSLYTTYDYNQQQQSKNVHSNHPYNLLNKHYDSFFQPSFDNACSDINNLILPFNSSHCDSHNFQSVSSSSSIGEFYSKQVEDIDLNVQSSQTDPFNSFLKSNLCLNNALNDLTYYATNMIATDYSITGLLGLKTNAQLNPLSYQTTQMFLKQPNLDLMQTKDSFDYENGNKEKLKIQCEFNNSKTLKNELNYHFNKNQISPKQFKGKI